MLQLSHFFVPHRRNNHRAHFLKPIAMYTAIFFLLALQTSFLFVRDTYPAVLGVSYSITPQEIIAQTNDQRGKNGLGALRENPQLNVAAQLKGQDMLAKGYWAHTSPDGKEPWYFILKSGYNYSRAGENLAKDFKDTTSTVQAWMNSPGHKANILNPYYKDIGIAVVSGPFNGYDTVIVVQMFGDPMSGGGIANSSLTQPPAVGAEVKPTPKPLIAKKLEVKIATASTVSVPNTASISAQLVKPPEDGTSIVGQTVANTPPIDPTRIFKIVVMITGLFFATLLIIDAYLINKMRIKRQQHGHSALHAIFLIIIMITLLLVQTGVVL